MSISGKEAFAVLGIECSTDEEALAVDNTIVKRQYRRLALKLHPDKNKSDPNAEVKFNKLKQAHDFLMDAANRARAVLELRALIQRREEMSGRDEEKKRMAEDLDRREADWNNQTGRGVKQDSSKSVFVMRAHHARLIEQLQESSRPTK